MKSKINNIKSIDYKKIVETIKNIKGIKVIKERGQVNRFKYVNSYKVYHFLGLEELKLLYLNCLGLDDGEYDKLMESKRKKSKIMDKKRREKHLKYKIETAHIRAGRLV